MSNSIINIGIIEPSIIVFEGVENVLLKSSLNINTFRINDIEDINSRTIKNDFDFIFLNPSQTINRGRQFRTLKTENPDIKWFAILYTIYDKEIISMFDDVISVDDSKESIVRKIELYRNKTRVPATESLSDREIEVLKEVVRGRSNKEIADLLNISIHTVMSHRKNITAKTNIKSQAGLTVYALTNNILSLEGL